MVFLTGFSPGTCDIVRVVLSSVLPSVLVFVRDLLNVPLSTAWAFVCAFSLSPLSLMWVLLCAFPSEVAALPPDPIEEVVPSSVRQVLAVPSELADVPPAEALPADPTVPAAVQSSARTAEVDARRVIEKRRDQADMSHCHLLLLGFRDRAGSVGPFGDDGAVRPGDARRRKAVDASRSRR